MDALNRISREPCAARMPPSPASAPYDRGPSNNQFHAAKTIIHRITMLTKICAAMRARATVYCVLTLLCAALSGGAAAAEKRPWDMETSIATRYFTKRNQFGGVDRSSPLYADDDNPVGFSPSGRWFYIVSMRGDLASDRIIQDVSIFETSAVGKAIFDRAAVPVKPAGHFSVSSASTGSAFTNAQWTVDEDALVFTGIHPDYNSTFGKSSTPPGIPLWGGSTGAQAVYRFSWHDGSLVRMSGAHSDARGELVADPKNVLFSEWAPIPKPPAAAAPPDYPSAGPQQEPEAQRGTQHNLCLGGDGHSTVLASSPLTMRFAASFEPAADKNGHAVIRGVLATYHPSQPGKPMPEDDIREFVVDCSTRTLSWLNGTDKAELRMRLKRKNVTSPLYNGNPFNVRVVEDPNTPPMVIAECGGKQLQLSEPDPALAGVEINLSKNIEWKNANGSTTKGVLTYPARHAPGPVPLVVQYYHYMPTLFRPDGPYPAGYATQLLAASGVAVLGVDLLSYEHPEFDRNRTPEEGRSIVPELDSAVAMLAAEGLVDPQRVGIMGFSHGAWTCLHAITHPEKTPIRAATAVDGTTLGFAGYLASLTFSGEAAYSYYEQMNGGGFWGNQAEWLENSPLFNVHRCRTPLLWISNAKDSRGWASIYKIAEKIEFVGPFRRLGRPLEFLWFPYGDHPYIRVRERAAAMKANVEWMRFWLKDEAPADPATAVRWAKFREQQDQVLRTAPAPRGKWMFVPDADNPQSGQRSTGKGQEFPDSKGDPMVLNSIAYEKLYGPNPDAPGAVAVFLENLKRFPDKPYTADLYDSLAEGYLQLGDVAHTIEAYEHTLSNPRLQPHAQAVIEKLKASAPPLRELQISARKAYDQAVQEHPPAK